jgi:hypothetical protein
MADTAILGERSSRKLAAAFDDEERAHAAVRELVAEGGLVSEQVRVVRPQDPGADRKLEPETRGIARTAVRSHLRLGIVGLLAGVVLAAVLIGLGVDMAESSPVLATAFLGFLGAVGGLLLAGLITARPDHQKLIVETKDAARHGAWSVVVHATDTQQYERARELLKRHTDELSETL